jgi:hypothetical protein
MSFISKILGVAVLCFLIAGCASNSPRTYLNYSYDAIERRDWDAAYRLMEDALVSNDPSLRKEAGDLVERYPQIRQAASDSFSKESLENTYRRHRERAWSIEKDRLSVYQRSLATPEQFKQATQNYQDVYGALIAESEEREKAALEARQLKDKPLREFEKEVELAQASSQLETKGNVSHLLEALANGNFSRKQAIALLGKPDAWFESFTILTWPLRIEGDNYTVLPQFIRSQHGVTHSLVLVFNEAGVLTARSLVRIVK